MAAVASFGGARHFGSRETAWRSRSGRRIWLRWSDLWLTATSGARERVGRARRLWPGGEVGLLSVADPSTGRWRHGGTRSTTHGKGLRRRSGECRLYFPWVVVLVVCVKVVVVVMMMPVVGVTVVENGVLVSVGLPERRVVVGNRGSGFVVTARVCESGGGVEPRGGRVGQRRWWCHVGQ